MKTNWLRSLFTLLLVAGCTTAVGPVPTGQTLPSPAASVTVPAHTQMTGETPTRVLDTPLPPAESTPARASATPPLFQSIGPDEFPPGINPLSGLPVNDPDSLKRPPALVSITNSPVVVRPQAGLSYSPFVYEMYLGEGASRFLAVFYGDYPGRSGEDWAAGTRPVVGPIRSGRLPYESLRLLYKGFAVFASAGIYVLPRLSEYHIVYNDNDDYNLAMFPVDDLERVAKDFSQELGRPAPLGLRFETQPPAGGQAGRMIWLPYHTIDQIIWRYDSESGSYHRWQDDGTGQNFTLQTDRLNGEALTYENVIILFANYHRYTETLFDIDLLYIDRLPALLFRDGQVYSIYWTTGNDEYERQTGRFRPPRFEDARGNPFPLKPGQTWVEIVNRFTPYGETVDSEDYRTLKNTRQPGSGVWAVYFFPPELDGWDAWEERVRQEQFLAE
ncbi:MAG: DUF3048 domain-containing protein [Chloroflexi bacterium]|nr:DUF3048 domain-containing protein [Chloroflexota bacterium]